MIWFRLTNADSDEEVYVLPDDIQRYIKLGDLRTIEGLNEGLDGACAGEVRKITFPTSKGWREDKQYGVRTEPQIGKLWEGVPRLFSLEVVVESVTAEEDFSIFEKYDAKEFTEVVDMINGPTAANNAVDKTGTSLLMRAVQDDNTLILATLLNAFRPKTELNKPRPSGHTALMYAVQKEKSKALVAMLKMGADPNVAVKSGIKAGWTPLHFACSFEYLDHVKTLLEYGADPSIRSKDGHTPLQVMQASTYTVRRVKKWMDEAVPDDEEGKDEL